MTRNEFFAALGVKLAGLPAEEQKKVIDYYNEYFSEAAEAGKTDEEILAALGTPDSIAARVKAEAVFIKAENKPTMANWVKVLIAVCGLVALPVALPVAIGILAAIFGITVGFFAVIVALAAAAVGMLVGGITAFIAGIGLLATGNAIAGVPVAGVGLLLTGLSLVFGVGIAAAARGLVLATTAISKWIYRKVSKKGEAKQ